jgi:hypothetical protein
VTVALAGLWPAQAESHSASGIAAPGWGIDQIRLRSSAGGRLLDLRYRVVDPLRAAPLLAAHSVRYIVEPRTGVKLQVPNTPKAGPLSNSGRPEAGRTYFTLFSNQGRLVRPGDRVAATIGELRLSDLLVE